MKMIFSFPNMSCSSFIRRPHLWTCFLVVCLLIIPLPKLSICQSDIDENESNESEPIEEAQGLDALQGQDIFSHFSEESSSAEEDIEQGETQKRIWFRYWGNIVAQISYIPKSENNEEHFGQALGELNFNMNTNPYEPLTFTLDGMGRYSVLGNADLTMDMDYRAVLNQMALSYRPVNGLEIAIGKERKLRAPGLFLTPGDFIYEDELLPGQRPVRNGVWNVRLSYQSSFITVDALYLPFPFTDDYGLPEKEKLHYKNFGYIARVFITVWNMDLGLIGGYLNKTGQAGITFSRFFTNALELHAEGGYRYEDEIFLVDQIPENMQNNPLVVNMIHTSFYDRDNIFRALIGGRYHYKDKGIVVLEFYYNGNGLTGLEQDRLMNLFNTFNIATFSFDMRAGYEMMTPRKFYAIASTTWTSIADLFNINANFIISLQDGSTIAMAKFEWLASSNSTLSLMAFCILGKEDGQYFARPFDAMITTEWVISF